MDGPDEPAPAGEREREWRRLGELLEGLLDLAPDAAARALGRLDPADAALRPRLEAALAAARAEDDGPLSGAAVERFAALLGEDRGATAATEGGPGATDLGPWRIEGELGRGGMGAVYAVRRADGLYEQRAALKL